jgi:hypothetical protein
MTENMFEFLDDFNPNSDMTRGMKPKENSKIIEITVIDPISKLKEVFKCEKMILMQKMKFFDLFNKDAINSKQTA